MTWSTHQYLFREPKYYYQDSSMVESLLRTGEAMLQPANPETEWVYCYPLISAPKGRPS